MVERSTRLALVLLAVVFVTGFPALAVADHPSGTTSARSASAPLTTELSTATDDLLTTTETSTTTSATATTTTDETLLNETVTVTTTTTDFHSNVTDSDTNATDLGPNENELDTNATAPSGDIETVVSNVTGGATNRSNVSLASVSNDSTDLLRTLYSVDASGTLSYSSTSLGVVEGSALVPSDGLSASEEGRETVTTNSEDREVTAEADESDGSGTRERRRSQTAPDASDFAVGVSALTAAALLPQLADGLVLVGNAGAVSAASTVVGSRSEDSRRSLGSRLDRLWRLFAPFRYSRYDDSDPLDHDARRALYETVERSPGTYLSALCERADVPLSTARHHLDVLEREGLVTTAKVRGRRRFYPAGSEDVEVELRAALQDEGTAAVLDALARLGRVHGGLLADELDLDASTVSHHLSRLEDAGLVVRERDGRAVVNRLAPEARRALAGDVEGDAEGSEAVEENGDVESGQDAKSEGRAEAD